MPVILPSLEGLKNRSFNALPRVVRDMKERWLPPSTKRKAERKQSSLTTSLITSPSSFTTPIYLGGGGTTATGAMNMLNASQNITWNHWASDQQGGYLTLNTSTVWYTWNAGGGSGYAIHRPEIYVPPKPAILTPDQIAERDRERAEQQRLYEAAQAARKLASEVADAFLLEHLTPEQRDYMKKHGFFVVEGGKSKSKYRIWTSRGVSGNIEKLNDNDGEVDASYCVHLDSNIFPASETCLGQKLMLEMAEDDLLNNANMTRRRAA